MKSIKNKLGDDCISTKTERADTKNVLGLRHNVGP